MVRISFPLIAVLLTGITYLYNVFLFLSYNSTGKIIYIGYTPWTVGAILILLTNRYLLRKARTVFFIGIINTALVTFWIVLCSYLSLLPKGFWPYFFSAALFICTGAGAVYLALQTISERQALLCTELSYLGAGFFFVLQSDKFSIPMIFNIPSSLMILINMLMLIKFRTLSKTSSNNRNIGYQGISFLIAALGLIGGIALSVLLLFSPSLGSLFQKLLSVLKNIVLWIWYYIGLLSNMLFPPPKLESTVSTTQSNFYVEGGDFVRGIQLGILGLLTGVLLTVIIISFLWRLFKNFRSTLLRKSLVLPENQSSIIVEKSSFLSILLRFINKTWHNVIFLLLWARSVYTPEGTFLLIEKLGSRKGFPRALDETPGPYLRRLAVSSKWKSPSVEKEVTRLSNLLMLELERKFYGCTNGIPKSVSSLNKRELKTLIMYFLKY